MLTAADLWLVALTALPGLAAATSWAYISLRLDGESHADILGLRGER